MSSSPWVPSVPAHRDRRSSWIAILAVAIGCLLLLPGAARADGAAGCTEPVSQVFAPWGDDDLYRMAPGGDFDGSAEDWKLEGGASIESGSSPLGGSSVLSLPRGSSAVSAPICLDGSESHARMFAQTTGGLFRAGRVFVEAISPNGAAVPVGVVRGDEDWDLSRRFAAPGRWAQRDGIGSFQYRFTAVGINDSVVDGLFVDPRARW